MFPRLLNANVLSDSISYDLLKSANDSLYPLKYDFNMDLVKMIARFRIIENNIKLYTYHSSSSLHHDLKHIAIRTVFSFNRLHFSVIISLLILKTCSFGTLVAGIRRQSLANLESFG